MMQTRRPKQGPPKRTPGENLIKVPLEYWDQLRERDLDRLCRDSLVAGHPPEGLLIRFLNLDILVDRQNRCICQHSDDRRETIDQPLLELVILVYLLNVSPVPLAQEMISVNDLKDAHFFQGPHVLKTAPVLERYGNDPAGFHKAAGMLDGEPVDLADAAYRLSPLPKVPLYYLLWEGDEEFKPHLSVLFDRSIERHLSADAIWGLVILVSDALLRSG
ncbi:MAG: DUF3786 domain-containing protein [Desulfobacterales bacterium]|uniref:DUF3786 domain-containing protein n=1 Tax=Candidatus Desulfatibia profunda TaxID=2841695 RepID=A0A8J6NZZ6_9BACT|nr:DUF3786 domain-containing protein [Candidatus Desulfatibia profunda]MBL7179034.1 DUF3786 domain-containing protein [Desulfobacterales bacterium]